MYSSDDKTYCYPDSSTLKNLHGATDAEELAELEALLYCVRHAELTRNPPPFTLTFQHLKDIHQHLFQDTYSWAGATRTVDMSKGTTRFAVWEQVEPEGQGSSVKNRQTNLNVRAHQHPSETYVANPLRQFAQLTVRLSGTALFTALN